MDAQEVRNHIDTREVVSLAKDLVNIPSPTGEEGEVAEFIVQWLERNGFATTLQEIESERYNAVGRLTSHGDGPSLMFNGHLDTSQTGGDEDELVYGEQSRHRAWEPAAYEEDGRLYGAGMMNDKGPIAAFLVAAKAIKQMDVDLNGDLIVAAVAGEIGKAPVDEFQSKRYRGHGVGTRHLLTHGTVSDYAIVAENSGWGIAWGLPGALYLKLTLSGKPTYISNIEYETLDEEHAIHKSTELARELREWGEQFTADNTHQYENGQIEPKVNIGAIRAGIPPKPNYVPATANLYVDVRIPPHRTPTDVRKEFVSFLNTLDYDVTVDTYRSQKGYAPETEEIHSLVDVIEKSYHDIFGENPPAPSTKQNSKWNDVNIYHEHGIPAVKIAPGPGPLDSQVTRRSVTPEELTQAAELYALCALDICRT